ncbi:MAG: hypothetical protein D6681_07940 [Calditrichaeota bacterium]|nr:MAG: hypothetical protein D6681_07940 [Calditrichota bacterium]
MSKIKFLLDEHVNPRLKRAVKKIFPEITIWMIGDPGAPSKSSKDPEILLWCEAHDFVLITNNRATMPVHLKNHLKKGKHVPGIFILNPNMSLAETAEELALIWAASDMEEYQNLILYLPISR